MEDMIRMSVDLIATKILQIKESVCGILDEISLYRPDKILHEDGNEEEMINNNLDDIQELYIELVLKVEKLEG
jgi:hypothetical protein